METLKLILFLIFITIGTSYCWGMRGTIIGGEKGAMLPGAFLGLILALFSGSEFLYQNPHLLAGVGAVSMYCGGNMTYGETLGLSMNSSPPPAMKKGLIALFVKGGIWFGLFGGYTSLYISVLSGKYDIISLVIFFVLLPVSALIFHKLLNTPYKPEENKFPKIYFSVKRKETWGGLFGMLAELIIFSAVAKDFAVLAMTAGTFLSGGIGWVAGQLFQIYTKYPTKKGFQFFRESNADGIIDSWKIMECVLGAIGGLGTAITFILAKDLFIPMFDIIDTNGPALFVSATVSKILFIVYILILFTDCMQYFVFPSVHKKYYKKLLKMRLLTVDGYNQAIAREKPYNEQSVKNFKEICAKSEFAIYSTIPMIMCFIGSTDLCISLTFTVIILVLCQEAVEKLYKNDRNAVLWKLMFLIPVFIIFAVQIISGKAFDLRLVIFAYSFFYEIIYFILKAAQQKQHKTDKTVHGYFILCCLIMNISIIGV